MELEYLLSPRRLENSHMERLTDLCLKHGFTLRGKAFFRIHGDGILQTIKFEHERVFSHYALNFSIDSMYSRLSDAWFSATRCPVNRSMVNFAGGKETVHLYTAKDGEQCLYITTPDEQLDILERKGLPTMDNVVTQMELASLLLALDQVAGRSVLWNDPRKIAPFLATKNHEDAARVIYAILHQHISAYRSNEKIDIQVKKLPWTEEDVFYYTPWFKAEDDDFLQVHRWIVNDDDVQIQNYLQANYERNIQRAKFCIRTQDRLTIKTQGPN